VPFSFLFQDRGQCIQGSKGKSSFCSGFTPSSAYSRAASHAPHLPGKREFMVLVSFELHLPPKVHFFEMVCPKESFF
jgi:hypothetical protein